MNSAQTIRVATWSSAAVAAVLSPIPFADEAALFVLYVGLSARLATCENVSLRAVPWRPILRHAVAGLGARAVMSLVTGFIPGVAAVVNAASAALLTKRVGDHVLNTLAVAKSGNAERAPDAVSVAQSDAAAVIA